MPQPGTDGGAVRSRHGTRGRDGAGAYTAAVALALAALAATRWLEGPLAGLFFSLPLVAVAISGSVGSVRSATVTAALAAVGLGVLMRHEPGLALRHTVETYRYAGFVATALLVAWVSGTRSEAYRREQEARLGAVAARRRAEIAVDDAERLSKLQEQVMAVVGHDLRTPLSAIRLTAATLLRRDGIGEDHRRQLERISASSGRMARMISDLIDFGRIRRGMALPLHRRAVDLSATCRAAVAELQQVYPDRQIGVRAVEEPICDGDPHRLLQVLSNLVGNALQHGAPSEPIDLTVRRDGPQLVVDIHNNGSVIAPDVLPFVFEPFRRGGTGATADTADRGSVGLGLFIVREIVSAHGGSVAVASDERSGTTFTVRLPAAPPATDARAAAVP